MFQQQYVYSFKFCMSITLVHHSSPILLKCPTGWLFGVLGLNNSLYCGRNLSCNYICSSEVMMKNSQVKVVFELSGWEKSVAHGLAKCFRRKCMSLLILFAARWWKMWSGLSSWFREVLRISSLKLYGEHTLYIWSTNVLVGGVLVVITAVVLLLSRPANLRADSLEFHSDELSEWHPSRLWLALRTV